MRESEEDCISRFQRRNRGAIGICRQFHSQFYRIVTFELAILTPCTDVTQPEPAPDCRGDKSPFAFGEENRRLRFLTQSVGRSTGNGITGGGENGFAQIPRKDPDNARNGPPQQILSGKGFQNHLE